MMGLALVTACAKPGAPGSSASNSPSSSELVGDAYAADLGLVPHDWNSSSNLHQTTEGLMMDGRSLVGCETPPPGTSFAFKILPSGHLYCYQGSSDLEVWVIGERLSGHVPTPEEIARASSDFDRSSS
jgi:hypothetical protein